MKTIIYNISKLYTMKNDVVPLKKDALKQCEVIEDAYIVMKDDLMWTSDLVKQAEKHPGKSLDNLVDSNIFNKFK